MNTCSKKRLAPHPSDQLVEENILLDTGNFFTLPNMLDDDTYVHMIQQDTCLYDIQDLEPEDIAERMRIKKKQALKRRMRRIRRAAEIQAGKVKWLRRELQIAHKRSRTEDGELGIVWWNREYWGTGFRVKRLGIKKEEPLTLSLWAKVEPPSTPPLTYPPSRTSSSIFCDIDPNDFVWSPVYALMSLSIRYSPMAFYFDFLSFSIHHRSSDIYPTDTTFSNLCAIATNYTLYPLHHWSGTTSETSHMTYGPHCYISLS